MTVLIGWFTAAVSTNGAWTLARVCALLMAQVREKDTLLRSLFPPPSLWGRNALILPAPFSLRLPYLDGTRPASRSGRHVFTQSHQMQSRWRKTPSDRLMCVRESPRPFRTWRRLWWLHPLSLSFLYDLFLFSLFACRPRISRRRLSSYFSFLSVNGFP